MMGRSAVIALLWTALIIVALIAAGTFALVLVLARRLRAVVDRVNLFLPVSEGHLPDPGTPLPDFNATAVDGTPVSRSDIDGTDRIVAFLTTECSSCYDQVPALATLDRTWPAPVVVIIGTAQRRAEMVAALAEHAVVIEEEDDGPMATAFDIHEFPAVLLTGTGVIQKATHGLAKVLEAAQQKAAKQPAGV
jgi:hypothetical protein